MNKQLTDEEVTKIEQGLRGVEALLEKIGREVCSANGSYPCWSAINDAIEKVQEAIHQSYNLYPDEK